MACVYFQNGSTALMWASGKGRTEIVELLLEHGAEVNTMNEVSYNYSGL